MKNTVNSNGCIVSSFFSLFNLFLGFLSLFTLISSSYAFEDARVLPKGRHRFSFSYGQSSGISQTFNSEGQKIGITDPYKISLDSATLASVDNDLSTLVDLLDHLGYRYDAKYAGNPEKSVILSSDERLPTLGQALYKGFLDVGVSAQQTQYAFQLQRGFSDRLSVGIMLPLIKTQVRTNKRIAGTNQTISDIKNSLGGWGSSVSSSTTSQIYDGLDMIDAADINTLQGILESRDYARFEDSNKSSIGDLTLGARYNYFKSRSESWINSAQTTLTAPTGKLKPTNTLAEIDHGQGTWDFMLGHVFNYRPSISLLGIGDAIAFSHSVNYRHRLPGSRLYRVRENPDDFLPNAASEEKVWMQLGDKFWTVFGATASLSHLISLNASYEFYWKGKDHYAGSRPKDYTYLSENTGLYLETASASIVANTIDAFLSGTFLIPGSLSLSYYHPVRGRNTVVAPIWLAEFAMYF